VLTPLKTAIEKNENCTCKTQALRIIHKVIITLSVYAVIITRAEDIIQ